MAKSNLCQQTKFFIELVDAINCELFALWKYIIDIQYYNHVIADVEVGFTESTISLNESMRRDISIMRRNSIASELRLTISGGNRGNN